MNKIFEAISSLPQNADYRTLAQILDLLPVSFWFSYGAENNYEIVFWSEGAANIYGFTKQEAIGTNYLDLFVVEDTNVRKQSMKDCDEVIAGSSTHPENCIAIDKNKNDEEVILLTNVFRVKYQDKWCQAEIAVNLTPSGFLDFLDDEYRQERIDENADKRTLRAFIDHYQAMMVLWSRTFAHEIRSELSNIRHSLKQLEKKYHGMATTMPFKSIERAGDSLFLMSENFLKYNRIQTETDGSYQKENSFFYLENTFNDIVGEYEYWASLIDTQIVNTALYDNKIYLVGEKVAFINVVRNLLANAIKHTKKTYCKENEDLNIVIFQECSNQSLKISIANFGHLSKDNDKHKFDPFYKRYSGSQEGTHLGLAIAKHWTQGIGGELRVYNKKNKRVIAELTWPLGRKI